MAPRTSLSLAALALAALAALLYLAFQRSAADEVEIAPAPATAFAATHDEARLDRPQVERESLAEAATREAATAPSPESPETEEPEAPAAPEPTLAEPSPPVRTIRVVARPHAGQSFSSAVSVPFLFRAVATPEPPGAMWPPAQDAPPARQCGIYALVEDGPNGYACTMTPNCERPLWVALLRGRRVVEARFVPPEQDEVVFVVDPEGMLDELCTLRFRPVDAGTEESIEVQLSAWVHGPAWSFQMPRKADGTFFAERLDPGPTSISISARAYEALLFELELAPGEDRDLGDVALTPIVRGELRVVVHRGPGAEEGDALVRCMPLAWIEGLDEPLTLGRTKEVGPRDEAALKLTVGTWAVRAESSSPAPKLSSRFAVVDVAEGTAVATVELVPATRVVLKGGTIGSRVRDAEDRWAHPVVFVPAGEERSLALVPGSYALTVQAKGRAERVVPLQVGADEGSVALD